eukprot:2574703-Prymnesium_polylepis.1
MMTTTIDGTHAYRDLCFEHGRILDPKAVGNLARVPRGHFREAMRAGAHQSAAAATGPRSAA